MKLKVVQIIDSLAIGGAEVIATNTANLLANKDNFESFLVVSRAEGKLKQTVSKKVNYIFLNRKSTLDVKAIFLLRKIITDNKIDIIHAHSSSYFIAVLIKITYPKVQIVWHDYFGRSLNERNPFPLNVASLFFKSIVTVNDNLKKWNKQNLFTKNIYKINNFATFNNSVPQTKLQGISNKRIVCVAGFREQKDHLNLLQAFNKIKYEFPEWSLHFIGKDYQNEYSKKIKYFIKENNLIERVFIYGACIDIEHILSQATIGVLSSKSEGLPVALIEYGLAKLPVLVTNVGDCNQVVKLDEGLVPPKDFNKFANGLYKLIKSQDLRKKIAVHVNLMVLQRFSEETFIKNIIKNYQ